MAARDRFDWQADECCCIPVCVFAPPSLSRLKRYKSYQCLVNSRRLSHGVPSVQFTLDQTGSTLPLLPARPRVLLPTSSS